MLTNVYFQAIYKQIESSYKEVIFNFDSCNAVNKNSFFVTNSTHLFTKKTVEFLLYTEKGTSGALNIYYEKLNAQEALKIPIDCNCIIKVIK